MDRLTMDAIDPRCFAASTINIISISGGKDSLAQWLRAIENNVLHISVFADTGHEHPLIMEYLDYLESKLGPIRRVKADFLPLALMVSTDLLLNTGRYSWLPNAG